MKLIAKFKDWLRVRRESKWLIERGWKELQRDGVPRYKWWTKTFVHSKDPNGFVTRNSPRHIALQIEKRHEEKTNKAQADESDNPAIVKVAKHEG